MTDYLVRGLAFDGQVRAFAVRTTDTISEAQRRHKSWPIVSAALGRTLTVSAMMGAMLKGDDKLMIKVEGGGPVGVIIVDANAKGEVRGYVTNPHVHVDEKNVHGKLNVAGIVGTTGTLSVVKDLGMKDNFTGQVPLVSGEIGDDFTYYFASSEQVPSAVGVGVLVNPDNSILASGGFIIQMMPGATEETISMIEKRITELPQVSSLIRDGLSPEQILNRVLGEENVTILDHMPVTYKCTCSKKRLSDAIVGLGAAEIKDMIEEDGKADAQCHFCNEDYHFTKEELEELYERATKQSQS